MIMFECNKFVLCAYNNITCHVGTPSVEPWQQTYSQDGSKNGSILARVIPKYIGPAWAYKIGPVLLMVIIMVTNIKPIAIWDGTNKDCRNRHLYRPYIGPRLGLGLNCGYTLVHHWVLEDSDVGSQHQSSVVPISEMEKYRYMLSGAWHANIGPIKFLHYILACQ